MDIGWLLIVPFFIGAALALQWLRRYLEREKAKYIKFDDEWARAYPGPAANLLGILAEICRLGSWFFGALTLIFGVVLAIELAPASWGYGMMCICGGLMVLLGIVGLVEMGAEGIDLFERLR